MQARFDDSVRMGERLENDGQIETTGLSADPAEDFLLGHLCRALVQGVSQLLPKGVKIGRGLKDTFELRRIARDLPTDRRTVLQPGVRIAIDDIAGAYIIRARGVDPGA